jgi:CRP/FNR family cyclic AMP-dependent transcriptional regulator
VVVTISLEPYLREHPIFVDIDPAYITVLAGCAANVCFKAGELIFRQTEPADYCYLIRDGKVSIELTTPNQAPLVIQTLGPGEVLGWSWLFPPYRWHYNARALETTRAVALDGACLRGKCDREPALGYELMKRFSAIMHARMQAARLQISNVYLPAYDD